MSSKNRKSVGKRYPLKYGLIGVIVIFLLFVTGIWLGWTLWQKSAQIDEQAVATSEVALEQAVLQEGEPLEDKTTPEEQKVNMDEKKESMMLSVVKRESRYAKNEETGEMYLVSCVNYNRDGNEISEISYSSDGEITANSSSQYDDEGKLIMRSMKHILEATGHEACEWEKYVYDEMGNQIECIYGGGNDFSEDEIYRIWEYVYDAHGNVLMAIRRDPDDADDAPPRDWMEYEYDEKGNMIREADCMTDAVKWWGEYEYDDAGKRIKETFYGGEGQLNSVNEYEYDTNGNLVQETKHEPEQGKEMVRKYRYQFDEYGNKTAEVVYGENGAVETESYWKYEYDSNKRILRKYDITGERYTDYEYYD